MERIKEEITKEYTQHCAELGQNEYQRHVLEIDATHLKEKLRQLNNEMHTIRQGQEAALMEANQTKETVQ
jgi:outer membrane murein-binding lipoprotein Lpp